MPTQSKGPKSPKTRDKLSQKISLLVKEEGMPKKQAVAVAHSLFRQGKL